MQKQDNILDYGSNNPWEIVNHGTPPQAMPANNPQYVFLWDPDSEVVRQLYGQLWWSYNDNDTTWVPRSQISDAIPFPSTFGDAWLYYQWASNLGPNWASGMTSDEIAAWNASCPIYVLNAQTWQTPTSNALDEKLSHDWTIDNRNQWKFSVTVYAQYVSAWLAMDFMWPGHVDDWWYMMYALADTTYGNELITQWIYEHPDAPPAVVNAIKNNNVETYQQMYGLLNEPILNNLNNEPFTVPGDFGWNIGGPIYTNGENWNYLKPQQGPFFKSLSASQPDMRWGFPLWTYEQRLTAYKTILPGCAIIGDGQWSMSSALLSSYVDIYIALGWLKKDGTVGSIWDPKNPPVTVTPPAGGPGGIPTTISDPSYSGNLPYAMPTAVPGQAPWSGPQGGAQHGYTPCQKESGIMIATPPIAAFAATFVAAPILPEDAKFVGAATIAGTTYLFLRQVLGLSGEDGEVWSKVNAASWLSVGGPATVAALIYGTNEIPANKEVFIGAAGAAGYIFLERPLFNFILGTSRFIAPTAAVLNKILSWIGNIVSPACWNENTQPGTCPCQFSYDKPTTQKSLINHVYYATGAQAAMRTQCLQVAMLQGNWGSDPKVVGPPCDLTQDIMPNPAACMNPSWWTPENLSNFPDANRSSMFANISPCLDPSNPSFLPPGYRLSGTGQSATLVFDQGLAAKDQACQAQGKYFRSTPNGCQNFSNIN